MSTTTFYPDPHPESTSVDGQVGRINVDESWSAIRGGVGNFSDDNAVARSLFISSSATNNQWDNFFRLIFLFDTSIIPDADSIDSGEISFYGFAGKSDIFSQSWVVCNSNPNFNTFLATSDYSNLGLTELSSTRITNASWNDGAYNDFTLNSAGLTAIDATGVSKFGSCMSGDFDDSEPAWQNDLSDYMSCYMADEPGTSKDPKLVITHTAPIDIDITPDPATSVATSFGPVIILGLPPHQPGASKVVHSPDSAPRVLMSDRTSSVVHSSNAPSKIIKR
jgi:hypothetical protein